MTALVNGIEAVSGVIELVRVGAWTADLDVDTEDLTRLEGDVAVAVEGLEIVGRAVAMSALAGRTRARVVGGHGGFGTPIPAQDYRNAPARLPLTDALGLGGEVLSRTVRPDLLAANLLSWTRKTGTVGEAVATLAAKLGVVWRVLPDGTTWLGAETWPTTKAKGVLILNDDGAESRLELCADTATILPGTVVEGRQISRVVHRFDAKRVETCAFYEGTTPGALGDRLLDAVGRIVNRVMSRVDYYALYGCRVVAQNADDSVELIPDDPRMPSKSKVPLRAGLPGVRVKVAPGARVLLGFENGDPSKPVATAWELGGMTELQLGGAAPIVRQGDMSSISIPPGFTFSVAVTGAVAAATGGPVSGVAVLTVVEAPTPLVGVQVTGSGKAKA